MSIARILRLSPAAFAGFEQAAKDKPAVITTNPVAYNGNPIRVSADVEEGGSLKVTVLSEDGKRQIAEKPITKTITDARLELGEKVEGKQVRLKFELNNAKIYSFNFEAPES